MRGERIRKFRCVPVDAAVRAAIGLLLSWRVGEDVACALKDGEMLDLIFEIPLLLFGLGLAIWSFCAMPLFIIIDRKGIACRKLLSARRIPFGKIVSLDSVERKGSLDFSHFSSVFVSLYNLKITYEDEDGETRSYEMRDLPESGMAAVSDACGMEIGVVREKD